MSRSYIESHKPSLKEMEQEADSQGSTDAADNTEFIEKGESTDREDTGETHLIEFQGTQRILLSVNNSAKIYGITKIRSVSNTTGAKKENIQAPAIYV